jgi:hypothetical protein
LNAIGVCAAVVRRCGLCGRWFRRRFIVAAPFDVLKQSSEVRLVCYILFQFHVQVLHLLASACHRH